MRSGRRKRTIGRPHLRSSRAASSPCSRCGPGPFRLESRTAWRPAPGGIVVLAAGMVGSTVGVWWTRHIHESPADGAAARDGGVR